MKSPNRAGSYLLGLDAGVSSIGWSVLGGDDPEAAPRVLVAGVHAFDAGVEGDIESGRDEARGAARREARLPRRMFWRRQRRRRKILRLLQRSGLLPPGAIPDPQAVHDYLLDVDARLRAGHLTNPARVAAHVLPYRLRADALDRPLEPIELGRALYHLAQRRGFLSNRKSQKKDEDEGVVKQGISDLQAAMDAAGAETLGAYFASLDPETERIRRRWTGRQMYIDEFNSIWEAQAPHHPKALTDTFRDELYDAIFFQRPLKSAKGFIGRCDLVPRARRAAVADRIFQRFRILQKVNDLLVIPPEDSPRRLSAEERAKLIDGLTSHVDLTFARIRAKKYLGLPKGTTFNFEKRDEEKKLLGHRTDVKMREAFGEQWDRLDEPTRDEIVLEILSFQNPDALARRARNAWGLDEQAAGRLADTRLEPGYAAHSRRALRRLVARMEDGTPYGTARRELFPDSFTSVEPVDRLPSLAKALGPIRNPAVERALTELRKLVNEIIRIHGKPAKIRIELARDLKRGRKERERKSREIDQQTKLRDRARQKLLDEAGVSDPRRPDVEKALLWEECGGMCPYTGRHIDFRSLFGAHSQFDVEHILPFSRSLDNGFLNKTLCHLQENRDRKHKRTPFEAYARDQARYAEILARVRQFQGKGRDAKLRRFEMEQIPEDFVERQLNDTRHASKKAAEYLALLYGGRTDARGIQRIQVSAGGLTAHLRNEWMLNAILGDGATKSREDHRHHAVDAIVVALNNPAMVQRLQRAAEQASAAGRKLFAPVPEPSPGFLEQAREKVLAISVSARLNKKLSGDLHKDTNYSAREYSFQHKTGKTRRARHFRRGVEDLTPDQVEKIVDPLVRERVRAWRAHFVKPKAGESIAYPTVRARDGREIPIKRVRIRKVVAVEPVGKGARTRYVQPGSNHHTVIVATLDEHGEETRWDDHPVTRLEAYRRKAEGVPIIQRDWGANRRFKFSLAKNEHLLIREPDGTEKLIRLLSVSRGANEFRLHTDARPATEARKKGSGARIRMGGEGMRKADARKVHVTYLGKIVPAND